ncbi:hypothetical protein [uncultured Rikenella sp.]|uniref:hypothetical protein n=1 Tax=uncultured Rikenella sp. TaxID=368003 RepID=UPI0025E2FC2B|nr:hypothetical protein [uncultured Rikenella sp.]
MDTRTAIPAPGYRDAGNNKLFGALGNTGGEGSVWSSTTLNAYSIYLGLHASWLRPCNAYSHAFGFQLRCLSE